MRSRAAAERLSQLADHLASADRDLVQAVFARGLSIAELARASHRDPRAVRRRLRGLLAHMSRREFAFVVAHYESWPALRRHAAALVLLQRRTHADAAHLLRISNYTLRREVHAVNILIDQARAMGRLEAMNTRGSSNLDFHEGTERTAEGVDDE